MASTFKLPLFLLIACSVTLSVNGQLKTLAEAQKRYVGLATTPADLAQADYAAVADREFDCFTPENQMKWGEVEKSKGVFNFSEGDKIVTHAQAHGQKVRGHTLVWHNHLPAWLEATKWTTSNAAELKAILQNHVTKQAAHFKGKLYALDVVNEAISDNANGSLRSDLFLDALGKEYIADSFRWAHEADPDVKLYYNEYGAEGVNHKSDAMLQMIKDLQAAKVPIHGAGFQSHFSSGSVPTTLKQNLERFAALGIDVAITELDIRVKLPSTAAELEQQAKDYVTVFRACWEVPRCVGVTMWGMNDKHVAQWEADQGQGMSLLFDANNKEKPAYKAVHDFLSSQK